MGANKRVAECRIECAELHARIAELELERGDYIKQIVVVQKQADWHKSQEALTLQNELEARNAVLVDALAEIAGQDEVLMRSFEDAYDSMIERARAALSTNGDK